MCVSIYPPESQGAQRPGPGSWATVPPHQHIPPGIAATTRRKHADPKHCLFLYMASFYLYELAIQGKRTNYKALQWKSIPELW